MTIDKSALLAALRAQVDQDLDAVTSLQQETQAGATHEESRPENDKDTRATEASYLARGLAKRVAELGEAAAKLARLALRSFDDEAKVALTALVTVESSRGTEAFFIAPAGGGRKVDVAGTEIRVITPASPLGKALLGARVDDEVEQRTPQGVRELTIVAIR